MTSSSKTETDVGTIAPTLAGTEFSTARRCSAGGKPRGDAPGMSGTPPDGRAGPAPSCLTRRIYVPNGQGQPMSKAMLRTLERLVSIRPRPRYAPQTGLRAKGMWRHDSIAGFGAITPVLCAGAAGPLPVVG